MFNGYGGEYDLLIDNKIRTEIKSLAHSGNDKNAKVYGLNTKNFDLLICFVGKLKQADVYIVSALELGSSISFPFNPVYRTKKQKKYLNSWKYLHTSLPQ